MEKFTKGPWDADFSKDDRGFDGLKLSSEDSVIISGCGCCGSPFGDNENDVHLIIVAPEMYALLIKAKETMLNTYDVVDYPADGQTDCDKVAAEIDKLLAKARGEQ